MKTCTIVKTRQQVRKLLEQLFQHKVRHGHAKEWRRNSKRITYVGPGVVEGRPSKERDVFIFNDLTQITKIVHIPLPEVRERIYVTLRDISEGGLEFLSPKDLIEGQQISIILELDDEDASIPATVVHCTGTVGMYKVGVKFELKG